MDFRREAVVQVLDVNSHSNFLLMFGLVLFTTINVLVSCSEWMVQMTIPST
jgi:hypothetical protein